MAAGGSASNLEAIAELRFMPFAIFGFVVERVSHILTTTAGGHEHEAKDGGVVY